MAYCYRCRTQCGRVSVRHTLDLCKKGWTDQDAVWEADSCESKKSRVRMQFSAVRGDKTAMWPFTKLLWILVCIILTEIHLFHVKNKNL